MFARYSRSVLLPMLLVIGLAGCPATDEIGPTIKVAGKVTIDGTPLQSGNITFHPDDKKGNKTKAGVSGIVKDGDYTLTSGTVSTNKPGAPAGWYKVTISPGGGMDTSGAYKVGVQKDKPGNIAIAKQQAPPIAEKFTKVTTTPLEVEVKSGGKFDLEATSK